MTDPDLEEIERRLKRVEQMRPLMGLGEWTKQVENGTVDWDELISKLEAALNAARELKEEG